jgi:O-antigen/teichoic acid export membrane protein
MCDTEAAKVSMVTRARHSRFLRHNSIFFIGAAAVGVLNYLYYPIMGRFLDTVSFGEVQTLISLFLQITIFLSVLGLVTINVVTNYKSTDERNAVVLELEKLGLYFGLLLLAVTICFSKQIAAFLHFGSTWPIIILMLALVVSVPFTFRGAFLRGKQAFMQASISNIMSAAGKLMLALLLVGTGLGTSGAIGGLVLAQLAAFGYTAFWAGKHGLVRRDSQRLFAAPNIHLLAPELKYGGLVLLGSFVITLQYSLDVVIVKHFFDPHTAGLYAGIASVARIIFFATSSIALVMMSLVRLEASAAENRAVLIKSLGLTLLAGLPLTAIMVWVPEQVTTVLMGDSYAAIAKVLPLLAISVCIVSILNVFVSYHLALRRYALAPLVLIGGGITYVLLAIHHDSLDAIVHGLFIGSISLLGILAIWMASRHLKELI